MHSRKCHDDRLHDFRDVYSLVKSWILLYNTGLGRTWLSGLGIQFVGDRLYALHTIYCVVIRENVLTSQAPG
jgi:hypothetical protein